MQDKIFEMSKHSDEMLPIEIGAIINRLQEVPEDINEQYFIFMTEHIEGALLFRDIVHASTRNPHLCRHLIDRLGQTQLGKLRKIAMHLASQDPERRTNEILEASLGVTIPTQETLSKASSLIELIKLLSDSDEMMSVRLANFSRDLNTLSCALAILDKDKQLENILLDRLAAIPENNLEELLQTISIIISNRRG